MGVILDITAGNRLIWGKNVNPEGVIFIDQETRLRIPPTLFADNTNLPIRTDLKIDSILFDPPWGINLPPWMIDPDRSTNSRASFFGDFKSKRDLVSYLIRTEKELKKYTRRICFKWGERNVTLWSILGIFTRNGWKEKHRVKLNAPKNRGGKSTNQTWWVILKKESVDG